MAITVKDLKEIIEELDSEWDNVELNIVDITNDKYVAYPLQYIEADPNQKSLDFGLNMNF